MATLTVLMTVFDGERYVGEAIDSILSQTFRDFSFLIIDDGSTDRTPEILHRYERLDPRVQLFRQPNEGQCAALNRGLRLAGGEYVARIDADDVSLPDRLERQMAFLSAHPRVGLLGGQVDIIDTHGRIIASERYPTDDATIRAFLLRANCFAHTAVVVRRDAALAVGGYRSNFHAAEDYDLWLRLAPGHELAILPAPVARYRIHDAQVSTRQRRQQVLSVLGAQLSARRRAATGSDPLTTAPIITRDCLLRLGMRPEDIDRAIADDLFAWARLLRQAGNHDSALRLAKDALAARPAGQMFRAEMPSFYWHHARAQYASRHYIAGLRSTLHLLAARPTFGPRLARSAARRLLLGPSAMRHLTSTEDSHLPAGASSSAPRASRPRASTARRAAGVSVVVTTYNQAPFIREAIESVLAQTLPPRDIIVVDDGSTDETPQRLAAFGDRIVVIRQPNRGVASSRNTGVRHATGDLIAFLDGDDIWEPEKLATQLAAARANPASGLIVVNGVMFSDSGILQDSLLGEPGNSPIAGTGDGLVTASCYERLLDGNFIPTTSQVMVPAAVLEEIGPSDESLPLSSDYDLYLRIAADYEITVVRERLVRWRYSPTSASGPAHLRHVRFAHDDLRVWKKQLCRPGNPYADRIRAHIRRKVHLFAAAAYEHGRIADRGWATAFLARLWLRNPWALNAGCLLVALWCPQRVVRLAEPALRRLRHLMSRREGPSAV